MENEMAFKKKKERKKEAKKEIKNKETYNIYIIYAYNVYILILLLTNII